MDLRTTFGLIQALRSKRWQQEVEITWGVLGNGAGTVETSRTNYYYVLPQGLQRVAQAINLGNVPPIPELMVELAMKDGAYAILGRAMGLPYWGDSDPYLPLHGSTHEAGEGRGRDPVNVYLRAITPLRADVHSPVDDSLAVAPGTYYDAATLDRAYFAGGDSPAFNLASSGSVTTSGLFRWDLLYLDTLTNALAVLAGTEANPAVLTYPDPPWSGSTAAIPIAYVYVEFGQTTIAETGLEDARQIITGVGIPQNAGWLRGYEICSGSPPSDGEYLMYSTSLGCWVPSPAGAMGAHNLLSLTHGDTVVQGATRGSLIYGTVAPAWDELVIGGAHQLFKVNAGGTEPAWTSFDWDDISAAAAADMVHDHSAAGEGGQVDVPDLTDTQAQLLTGVQKTDLTDGGQTVLHSHAGVTTSSVQITLLNNSGNQLVLGDVVVTGSAVNESVVGTTRVGYGGKVLVTAETIASGSSGLFWERGGPFNILTVGAISRNDGLRTAGTIFRAESAGAPTSGSVFAVALTPAVASGSVNGLFLDAEGGAGAGGDDGAPTDAKYIVTEANGDLTAEIVLPQFGKYLPDTPPAAAGAYDDEFDSATIDGKWSRISLNLGAVDILAAPAAGVYDLSTQLGTMLIQPGPNNTWSTIYQTGVSLPANCRIVAKIYPAAVWGASHRGTFAIGINDNSGVSPAGGSGGGDDGIELGVKTLTFNPGGAREDAFVIRTVETVNGAGTEFEHTAIPAASEVYLMIIKTGTTYRFFWSMNGRTWVLIDSHVSAATFTYLVIGGYRETASPSPVGGVDFIRYFADNAFNIGGQ